jgi:kynureninase
VPDAATRAAALDAADPLARFRDRFVFGDPALVYLDGNSLGRLPVATRDRLRGAVDEWGERLVGGWRSWLDLATEAGDLIGTELLGTDPGEVVLADSTSVNLYKLAVAALDARPDRRVIVTDDDNFPTDRYVLQGLAAARGLELRLLRADPDLGVSVGAVRAALDRQTALVCLSHVAYRSGARADLVAITAAAHEVGALTLWDLCHSVGAVPVPLHEAGADLAVGCTYKYLNAGPGAPAFLYVRADLRTALRQPIWGWFGQRDQFAMGAAYAPVDGVERFCSGTPPVLGGYAVLEGARLAAEAGIAAKAAGLTESAIELADGWLTPHGFAVATPREPDRRGAHVTLRHPGAWQVCQALTAAGVVGDFRAPDRLRLGFAPLYTRYADVVEGFVRLRTIMESEAWQGFPAALGRVT